MREKNVVFISDNKQKFYALTNALMIFSQTTSKINIYIILVDLSKSEKKEFEEIVNNQKTENLKLIYKESSSMELGKSKLEHVSEITNVRLYLSSILVELSNVLYLDNDTVTIGDIDELFSNLDYSKSYGRPWYKKNSWIKKLRKKKLFNKELYVNAGVLFLNLNYWRENNLEEKLINFLIDKSEIIKFADQDTLNCNIPFSPLPYTWNLARSKWEKSNPSIAENSKLKIYHFLSTLKQWDKNIKIDEYKPKNKGNLSKKELNKMIEPQKIWKDF